MTWLKTGEDFPKDCHRVRLSDAAYRLHHEGLSWVMAQESDGAIHSDDLLYFARCQDPPRAAQELVDVGFWRKTRTGWQVIHSMDDQPEADVLVKRRQLNAERQRRKRRKAVGLPDDGKPSKTRTRRMYPRDRVRDDTRDGEDTTRVTRFGAERSGTGREPLPQQTRREEENYQPPTPVPDGWSVEDPPFDPWAE